MTEAKITQCPTCGEPPEQVDRVRETTQTAIGDAFPEPRIVDRGLCKNGHKWFARDEKSAEPDQSN